MKCAHCGLELNKSNGAINRAKKDNRLLFCNRTCFGLSKRLNKSKDQIKEEKRLYDIQYRNKNSELIKVKNAAFAKTEAGRAMQKRNRNKRKEQHLAYCSTPEYRACKKEYDKKHRAKKLYGELWESSLILNEIINQIDTKELRFDKGLYNKSQKRKRKQHY